MRYRKLDENGDMTFGHQQNDFYRDVPDAPAQAVSTRLKLWTGEWFLNSQDGTPYQFQILGMGKVNNVEPVLRQRILQTEGVNEIINFNVDYNANSRNVIVNSSINTIYGTSTVEVVL